jgi:enamine deaminase RidA (YjgF/YER057c/UK114 family)
MSVAAKLKELGIEIPPAPAPAASYAPFVVEGNLVYIAGQGTFGPDGKLRFIGKVGRDLTEQEGYQAARLCALNCLSQLQAAAGSLDRVKRIVRVSGLVNCVADYADPHKVVNGASDVLVQIFGEKGRHARMAAGTESLPLGIAALVEMIAALE